MSLEALALSPWGPPSTLTTRSQNLGPCNSGLFFTSCSPSLCFRRARCPCCTRLDISTIIRSSAAPSDEKKCEEDPGEVQPDSWAVGESGPFLPSSAPALSDAFRRRFLLGTAAGLVVALGGNLGGITSSLLGLNPEICGSLKLDVLYPVNGFKRCLETNFEFLYPAAWVGDQRLLYRAVERAERERSFGLPPVQERASRQASFIDPVVAFGPPGSNGELNVSVIMAPISLDFRLEKLGGPQEAGEVILNKFIASRNSKIIPSLVTAKRRDDVLKGDKVVYYTLEFTVKSPTFLRHNVAVYAAHNGELFSLNAQTPESQWSSFRQQFHDIANSFKVLI